MPVMSVASLVDCVVDQHLDFMLFQQFLKFLKIGGVGSEFVLDGAADTPQACCREPFSLSRWWPPVSVAA